MNHLRVLMPAAALLAAAGMFLGCRSHSSGDTDIGPGVPLDLAKDRKASISDISYNIFLSIPASRDSAVKGRESIFFTSSRRGTVFLDFAPAEGEHIALKARKGRNSFDLDFTSDDRFLNRNQEYLYSLFVPAHARSVFPCFDQPDLKARFSLTLEIPEGWEAVSNTSVADSTLIEGGRRRVSFGETLPISTYLFAFSAGRWNKAEASSGGRHFTAYYRENDPSKTAQLPDIFEEVSHAVSWMEDYTGIPMPSPKYDFVIVPNFQFGGMEHPGSIFFNENTMFLGKQPTPDEREKRIKLIAHETSHLWFGDLVTMRWFDEVWTKEVFANHMAAKMVEPMFPETDHDLTWLRNYLIPAMDEERTEGTTAIRQELPNLADAGLIYNNMVYDKAPVMMRMLEEMIGADTFREGLQKYLSEYSFANSTWDDLVGILDGLSEKDVKGFSTSWVNERRGGDMAGVLRSFADGSRETGADAMRLAGILTRKEEYLAGKSSASEYLDFLLEALDCEGDPLVAASIVSCISTPLSDLEDDPAPWERRLLSLASRHPLASCRLQLKRMISSNCISAEAVNAVHELWLSGSDKSLTVDDYMSMACQLAIRMPDRAHEIISAQRARLDGSDPSRPFNKNKLEQFDFVSRAALPEQEVLDSVFETLLTPEGRAVEPWAATALGYLNHFLCDSSSVKYIRPALDKLLEVKATGDIFFTGNWCKALLGGHRSPEALEELEGFIRDNRDYPQLLKNKVLVAAYNLQRANDNLMAR